MLKGFRDFIFRGNIVDLAVAVIIGASFGAITASLTGNIITPFISALVGAPDFSSLVFHMPVLHPVPAPSPLPANYIAPGEIHYGIFLNAVLSFLINAAAIYFLVVLPFQKVMAHLEKPAPAGPATTKICPQCESEIPIGATRCRFCTQTI